jgi:hypothetical protein
MSRLRKRGYVTEAVKDEYRQKVVDHLVDWYAAWEGRGIFPKKTGRNIKQIADSTRLPDEWVQEVIMDLLKKKLVDRQGTRFVLNYKGWTKFGSRVHRGYNPWR